MTDELLTYYSTMLVIDIDTYTEPPLLNEFVKPDSTIKSPLTFNDITFWNGTDSIKVTDEELNKVYYPKNNITLYNQNTKVKMTFENNGFTVKDLFNSILEFENKSRPLTKWYNGIDAHHIFFEGLYWNTENNAYEIEWGS